jgi:hypothetical protein
MHPAGGLQITGNVPSTGSNCKESPAPGCSGRGFKSVLNMFLPMADQGESRKSASLNLWTRKLSEAPCREIMILPAGAWPAWSSDMTVEPLSRPLQAANCTSGRLSFGVQLQMQFCNMLQQKVTKPWPGGGWACHGFEGHLRHDSPSTFLNNEADRIIGTIGHR